MFVQNLRRFKRNIYDPEARRCNSFQKPKPAGATSVKAATQLGLFVSRCGYLSLREDETARLCI